MMKRSRQPQIASSSKPGSGDATLATQGRWNGAAGGGDPAGDGPAYETNACQHGDRCRCQHSNISREEYQRLNNEARGGIGAQKGEGKVVRKGGEIKIKLAEGQSAR